MEVASYITTIVSWSVLRSEYCGTGSRRGNGGRGFARAGTLAMYLLGLWERRNEYATGIPN